MTSWIFQGNPRIFDIDKYLQRYKEIRWHVSQERFKDEISTGDEVFMWRADGGVRNSGGIVARGVVVSPPQMMEDDDANLWVEAPDPSIALLVRIDVKEVRLTEMDGMLLRRNLKQDARLADMGILKFHQHTNYRLEPSHAEILRRLWKDNESL